ncbi:hypothetical protein [Bernardetia sp.]|uniref:hypothetical protein n=1 Tax=Bernardetia sp. TaxID=1937974 RepID=UPI0025B7F20E|nr:hypothetical protein [Bernardetia sp.]
MKKSTLLLLFLCLTTLSIAQNHNKIIAIDNFLLHNIPNEGWVVHDIKDPASPTFRGFLKVEGSTDAVIRNGILYTQNQNDLVGISVGDNFENVEEPNRKRIKDLFENGNGRGSQDEIKFYPAQGTKGSRSSKKTLIASSDTEDIDEFLKKYAPAISLNGTQGNSVQGSMSRFALSENTLFAIDKNNLHIVELDKKTLKKAEKSIRVSSDATIETAFVSYNRLFIGAKDALYILGISNLNRLEEPQKFSHERSCDPVVATRDYAYITLNAEGECEGQDSRLEIVSLKNGISGAVLSNFIPLDAPRGLALSSSEQFLFICDRNKLKVFDILNPREPKEKYSSSLIDAYDVLIHEEKLIVVGKNREGQTKIQIFDEKLAEKNRFKLLGEIIGN